MSGLLGEAPQGDSIEDRSKRAALGTVVEAITGLCYLLGFVALPAAFIDSDPSERFGTAGFLLFIGGASWEAIAGGLLLAFRPRAMAGTLLESLRMNVWRISRRSAAWILVPSGVFWASMAILTWATVEHGLDWSLAPTYLLVGCIATGVPVLLLYLRLMGVLPAGERRRDEDRP